MPVSTRTSAVFQKLSSCRRCDVSSASKPSSTARSRVREQRSTSSAGGAERDDWYVAYFTMRIGTPGWACTVRTASPTSPSRLTCMGPAPGASTTCSTPTPSVMSLLVVR